MEPGERASQRDSIGRITEAERKDTHTRSLATACTLFEAGKTRNAKDERR
jgi:hypothetical protein